MTSQSVIDRFKVLRELSDKLCAKDSNDKQAVQAHSWLVNQLHYLRELCDNENTTLECIRCRVDDILCVVEADDHNEEESHVK